jgi:hypothetical protein
MIKFSRRISGLVLTFLPFALPAANATPPEQGSIPQFGYAYLAWSKVENAFQPPPGGGPGPVMGDKARTLGNPAHPIRIADLNNPILKPWVIKSMAEQNALAAAGKRAYEAQANCQPGGVPGFLVMGALNPMYIVQGPRDVVLINEGGASTRHIYLNVPHTAHPRPSPYGESVGWYEGSTLVVDTIGLSDDTYIDNFRTPHTTQEHVVERFRVVDDPPGARPSAHIEGMVDKGKSLQVDIHVEDPGAFNMPWNARQTYRLGIPLESLNGQLLEASCAENNPNYIDSTTVSDIPVAAKLDF